MRVHYGIAYSSCGAFSCGDEFTISRGLVTCERCGECPDLTAEEVRRQEEATIFAAGMLLLDGELR